MKKFQYFICCHFHFIINIQTTIFCRCSSVGSACLVTAVRQQHPPPRTWAAPMLVYVQTGGSEMAQLPSWLARGQQVSHQKWIWGIHVMQTTKHINAGFTLSLKPKGIWHLKSKTEVSVAPQKGLTSFKKLNKLLCWVIWHHLDMIRWTHSSNVSLEFDKNNHLQNMYDNAGVRMKIIPTEVVTRMITRMAKYKWSLHRVKHFPNLQEKVRPEKGGLRSYLRHLHLSS